MNKLRNKYRYSIILLRELVITDFKLRYQGSTLGYLWALLRPLFLFAILYVVFVYFLRIGRGVEHWPAALLLGIVLWNFFSEITKQGLKSVVNSGGIIRKINLPKYIIVFSTSISAVINLMINMVLVVIVMAINGVDFTWSMLLVPFFILEIYFFALGVAFILGTVYVKYRDVSYIWDIITQAFFYGSAIMFPITRVISELNSDVFVQALLLNPAAQAINEARILSATPDLPSLYGLSGNLGIALIPYCLAIATFVFGALYFRSKSPTFAEDV